MSPPLDGTADPEALRHWLAPRLDGLEAKRPAASRVDSDPAPYGDPSAPLAPAAVLVGLVERPAGPSVILTRRSDELRRHTGQVALPGGRCDPGETAWGAALREAHEEIGLDPVLVDVVGLSTPYRTGTGFLVTPVVGLVAAGFRVRPNPGEVAEVFEAPLGFLIDPLSYEEREATLPDGVVRRYYVANWGGQTIWGATAGMLRALGDRLRGA